MARIRSTHPGQWTDGDFLECSPLARLLALALRNLADDHGVFRWKPMTLKAECLPADNCDINGLLDELLCNEQLVKYDVEGKSYGIIKDFTQWQRPKKPKYLHPVPDWFSTSNEPVDDEVDTDSEISPQRKEEGGRSKEEKKDLEPVAKPRPQANDDFLTFKAAFPRRDGAQPWAPAEKKFNALVKTGVEAQVMIRAAEALAREESARGNVGTKFIPQAITWLNQSRFADYAAATFAPEAPLKGYYAAFDSPQLEAWDRYERSIKGRGLPRDTKGGWRVDSEWPPGHVSSPPPPLLQTMQ